MTAEHLLQHRRLHDAIRRDTWPDPTLLRDKLYGNLGELRRTAAFVRATGIYDDEEEEEQRRKKKKQTNNRTVVDLQDPPHFCRARRIMLLLSEVVSLIGNFCGKVETQVTVSVPPFLAERDVNHGESTSHPTCRRRQARRVMKLCL